jgi:hypothetical protein
MNEFRAIPRNHRVRLNTEFISSMKPSKTIESRSAAAGPNLFEGPPGTLTIFGGHALLRGGEIPNGRRSVLRGFPRREALTHVGGLMRNQICRNEG